MTGAVAMDDQAFARLRAAEERSFWFRSRNRLVVWALETFFPAAQSFLEVGCGNGYVLSGVAENRPGMRIAGCDLSEAGLRHAAQRVPSAELWRGDAAELPADARFDVIGAFDVLEHIVDDRAALREIMNATCPGGGVLLTVPQHRWLWGETDRFSGHQRRYRRRELTAKLTEAGFRIRHVTSFVTLLLPVMAASRLWNVASARPFDPGRELTLSPGLDRQLERVMRVETGMITSGARLPAGGSLLVVAANEPH